MRRIRTSHSLNDQFIEMSNLTQDELNRIAKHEIITRVIPRFYLFKHQYFINYFTIK